MRPSRGQRPIPALLLSYLMRGLHRSRAAGRGHRCRLPSRWRPHTVHSVHARCVFAWCAPVERPAGGLRSCPGASTLSATTPSMSITVPPRWRMVSRRFEVGTRHHRDGVGRCGIGAARGRRDAVCHDQVDWKACRRLWWVTLLQRGVFDDVTMAMMVRLAPEEASARTSQLEARGRAFFETEALAIECAQGESGRSRVAASVRRRR